MNDIIMQCASLLITIIVAVIARYAIPALKIKIGDDKFNTIVQWASIFVSAAEKIFVGDKKGDEKREFVMELLTAKAKELNLDLTEEQIRSLLESALTTLKAEGIIK